MHPHHHHRRRIIAAHLTMTMLGALGLTAPGLLAPGTAAWADGLPDLRSGLTALQGSLAAPRGSLAAPRGNGADPRDNAHRAVDRAAAVLEDATARARGAARQLAVAMHALPDARRRVADARGRLIAAQVRAHTARRAADAGQTRYAAATIRSRWAEQHVEVALKQVDMMVDAAYQGSMFTALNIVADATDPGDFIDRIDYVGQVLHHQQADVEQLTAARQLAQTAQDEAGAARAAAVRAERVATGLLGGAHAASVEALRARDAVLALAASRRHALRVARSERGAVLAHYRLLKAEEARIVASLRAWDRRHHTGGFGPGAAVGVLTMPVHGWKSSDFGMRLNPVYGVWRLHAGTDFAAAAGTPIHAAAAGRVINAGWSGGYGNYTCIGHGDGLSTCYGHQSVIEVHPGQDVRRGQIIGRVGTTGASTGYHLHFEVRRNGEPRNPLGYLPRCLC